MTGSVRWHSGRFRGQNGAEGDAMATVLVIDDDLHLLKFLARGLNRAGYACVTAQDGSEALRALTRSAFDAVVCDLTMPEVDGFEVLRHVQQRMGRSPPVIVMTAYGSVTTAVKAMKLGAADFLEKPVELSELRACVQGAINRGPNGEAIKSAEPNNGVSSRIVGSAGWLDPFLLLLDRVGQTDTVVLIEGETGIGKSAVAREIHRRSWRHTGPFVELNCAAIPDQLMESELFGHKRGAFTSADADKEGKVALADGGTLFLDEIGELKLELQGKLLHLLSERTFQPVGGKKQEKADVRFVAATNRHLQREVEAGRFRSDLYFRLNVLGLSIPPLRDRIDDIPILLEHFRGKVAERVGHRAPSFSEQALAYLTRYDWPGNVRELENVVEQMAILLGPDRAVEPGDLPSRFHRTPEVPTDEGAVPRVSSTQDLSSAPEDVPASGCEPVPQVDLTQRFDLREVMQGFERSVILNVLRQVGGNKTQAAKRLGMKRTTLIEKCRKLEITPEEIAGETPAKVEARPYPLELELNGSVRAVATPPDLAEFEPALRNVGRADSPVLIRGPEEAGTIVAERIHQLGDRSNHPIHHCARAREAAQLLDLEHRRPGADHDLKGTWALYSVHHWSRSEQETLGRLIDHLDGTRLTSTRRAEDLPRVVVIVDDRTGDAGLTSELLQRLSFFNLRVAPAP